MTDRWIVAGLGNPGPQYERTRHNVGHMVVDELAARTGEKFSVHKQSRAQIAETRLRPGGPRVVLVKPLTYMNVSGAPVVNILKFFGADPDHLIVVHDELDIDFDTVKLKRGGGEGGHNGLRDISKVLGTKDYLRVRVGVGRPPGRMDTAAFVLKPFTTTEATALPLLLDTAADAVEKIIDDGLTAAQNSVHAR
ncbi:aminoacyl-tRNA hydrolase [Kocuria sp. JC486]|uniref:aminoacyl-tRNA hydrolase n=1 Tax=Kocuria sp. JC486 TaxID=1970736 RepID=UPI0014218728|nr:aminoacyl-tRNA hydrolase [Kocuria sp. JC486]NHU85364.1 aminoacyl-tRNA hydrolase [Kocuria sp. JC486]